MRYKLVSTRGDGGPEEHVPLASSSALVWVEAASSGSGGAIVEIETAFS
jgi:hypothetical protein